ncbi:MAG: flavodoxin domain-containing protein [Spirochaetota bacterium]|nr:flavodoxin domain-containing protein [Spirochaetota bacterium]
MKGLIIYKSNYGTTEQYARWLSEETGYPNSSVKSVQAKDIMDSDTVIIGAPVFANRSVISRWIEKNWRLLGDKRFVLYTTSGTYPEDPQLQEGFASAFKPEVTRKIKYFPQGGRMVFAELSLLHKFLMKLGRLMEKDPAVRAHMEEDVDRVDRKGLAPIIDYIS